jgi:multiple sugar transport system substrate-binding protein
MQLYWISERISDKYLKAEEPKMKKALALILAVTMLLSLCACGSQASSSSIPTEAPASESNATTVADANKDADIYSWIVNEDTSIEGTVRFYIPFKGEQGMDAMIAEFNAIYPNITVELNTYSNNTDGNVGLNTAIMAGECDVVASFEIHNVMNRMNNGMYIDISDRVAAEGINLVDNWGTEAYNLDGKTYVLPNGGFSYFVAINKDAWDAAGLGEIPDEWTWDEYIEASRAMTEYNADGSVAVYGGSQYSVIADLTNVVYQVNGRNRFYNADGSCAFDTDYLKDTIQKFIDAEKEGIWYSLESYRTDNYKEWFAYAEGKINSGISGNVNRFLADTETYPQDHITAFAPYPVVEAGQTNYMSGVNYFSFVGLTTGCQDEEAAWAFTKFYSTYGAKYLTVAGHQSAWAGTDSNEIVSLIYGSEEEAAKIIDVESYKKWVGNAGNPSSYDNISTAYSELNSIFSEYVMYAYTGDMTLDAALAEATELGNQAIDAA